jgi:F-type H+-transporting ATPase subunit delta
MAKSSTAIAYAKALLEIAVAQGTVDLARSEMERVGALANGSFDLRQVFGNPTIREEERRAVVLDVADALKLSATTKNFLLILAERRRLALIGDIVTEFQRQLDVHTGGARAQVFSPSELSAVQLARIKDALQKSTGKKVVVESIVDPTLLGGLRIQVEGKILDSTLLLQLEALRGLILTAA